MAIKMVRKPSETPNIKNIDDIVGLRYAYGNQNGYVISKGNEVSYSVNGSTFTINSGRLVLQGVEVDIDANGLDLTVDNIATKQYYSAYLTVNLALNTVQIQFTVDTAGYPEIDAGDDLTKNTSGIARLELYRFTAQNGVISGVERIVKSIPYPLENYNIEKGKVEDRLKTLETRKVITLWERNGAFPKPWTNIEMSESVNVGDILEIYYYSNIIKVCLQPLSVVDDNIRPISLFSTFAPETSTDNNEIDIYSMSLKFNKNSNIVNVGGEVSGLIKNNTIEVDGFTTGFIYKINKIIE